MEAMEDLISTVWPKSDAIPATRLRVMGLVIDKNGTFFDNKWPPSWMCQSEQLNWLLNSSTSEACKPVTDAWETEI